MPDAPVYPRLSFDEQSRLLRQIVSRCPHRPSEPTPVVVFDLDGTLMDNRPRTCAILRDFGESVRAQEPVVAEALLRVQPEGLAYLLSDSMGALGIHRTDHVAAIQAYWRARFFIDDYLHHDIALPGAVNFAHDCYEAGAILVYMTGRDLPLMGAGSFRSLRDLGFPIGVPGTELVLKPDAAMPDEAYKRLEAPKLARVGRVVAAFDNEPGNCNVFKMHFPEAESVFVDTQHLPGAPPLSPGVVTIGDFRSAT
jgi:hypothetical protein